MCNLCPRKCNIDRTIKHGFCGTGMVPKVAKAFLHKWEEPCISGQNGSGTVFFSGCNLKCIYCQNYKISQENVGQEITVEILSQIFLELQEKGAHNINLVNPSHYVQVIRESILSIEDFKIPIVYNTNGYDSQEGLAMMEGLVDIYLPDIKYCSTENSSKFSDAADYFQVASKAVLEMYRQVGPPVFDDDGMIKKGLIIRHLILPGHTKDSKRILDWIKENLPGNIYVSLMSQYTPYFKAVEHPEIGRRITRMEYERVAAYLYKIGLENGYVQERDSAKEEYIPSFDL